MMLSWDKNIAKWVLCHMRTQCGAIAQHSTQDIEYDPAYANMHFNVPSQGFFSVSIEIPRSSTPWDCKYVRRIYGKQYCGHAIRLGTHHGVETTDTKPQGNYDINLPEPIIFHSNFPFEKEIYSHLGNVWTSSGARLGWK